MYYFLGESYFLKFLEALKFEFLEVVKVGDIGEQVRHGIAYNEIFRINLFGYALPFNQTTVGEWIAMAIITILALWLGRSFNNALDRRQIVAEGFVGLFVNLCRNNGMNKTQTEEVAPFVGSIAVYICFTNLTSLLKMAPPAKDPVFTVTLALFTIFYVILIGIKLVGIKGFLNSMTYPSPALVPFKILDFFIKPISLSLRLFGNVFGAFILMEFVFIIIPVLIPGILGIWFDLADGILQAAVFSYLSIVYIGEIVEGAEHAKEAKIQRQEQKNIKARKKIELTGQNI